MNRSVAAHRARRLRPLAATAATLVLSGVLVRCSASVASDPCGPTGAYWRVTAAGAVTGVGVATLGSLDGIDLNRPIVAMAATPSRRGYWLLAADGGVFAFGDAGFFGSQVAEQPGREWVDIVSGPTSGGYRLLAEDGTVAAFGNARNLTDPSPAPASASVALSDARPPVVGC